MTALGKLVRTTAFKLSARLSRRLHGLRLRYLGYVAWNAQRVLDDQFVSTIDAEINGLSEQYRARRPAPPRQHRRAPLARAGRLALSRHHARPASGSPAMSARCRRASLDEPGPVRDRLRPHRRDRGGAEHRAIVRVYRPARRASGCSSAATSRSARACARSSAAPSARRCCSSACSAAPAAGSSPAGC